MIGGARERKPFIFSERNFLKICVLCQRIVYLIHFHDIHTFAYQKTLLHTLLLLVFKIVESLQCILHVKDALKLMTGQDSHNNYGMQAPLK